MSQLKFSSLEDLVSAIKQKRAHAPKVKKVVTPEERIANELAKKIEDEALWKPAAVVLLTVHQHCKCGQDFRSVAGAYVESFHARHKARRLKPAHDLNTIDKLPHRYEEINEDIAICPHCLLERDVASALINPIHEVTVQLPLFDHVLQYGEFL